MKDGHSRRIGLHVRSTQLLYVLVANKRPHCRHSATATSTQPPRASSVNGTNTTRFAASTYFPASTHTSPRFCKGCIHYVSPSHKLTCSPLRRIIRGYNLWGIRECFVLRSCGGSDRSMSRAVDYHVKSGPRTLATAASHKGEYFKRCDDRVVVCRR